MQYADVEQMRHKARKLAGISQEIRAKAKINRAGLEQVEWSGVSSDKYKHSANEIYSQILRFSDKLDEAAAHIMHESDEIEVQLQERAKSDIME
jgi:uncharacterized protein YukE